MASSSPQQDTSFRNRQRSSTPQSGLLQQPVGNTSPASSATASTSGNNLNLSRMLDRPSLRLSSLQLAHSAGSISINTPSRKLVVRSDPSIVTCFDPADKELYDLWAPKH